MKKNTSAFLTVILFLTFPIINSYSQWEPDVRLTNTSGNAYISLNNSRSIAANGNIVLTVWCDTRDGNEEIYNKRSTDGGTTWGTDTRLTNDPGGSVYPSIAISGSFVYVVWMDSRNGSWEIYHKRSTDMGITWGADIRLTNDPFSSEYPSIAISGSNVHVVWSDSRTQIYQIYYKQSTDGGINWGADTRLTNNIANSRYPSIAVSGLQIHIVWNDIRDGNDEIYYKRSTDGGTTWAADTRLTNDIGFSYIPSVSVSGNHIHVVWNDSRDGNLEIYNKRSTDGGATWGTDTRLTNDPGNSSYPSIAISGLFVQIVWMDYRDNNSEIYCKNSTDGGTTWDADTRLTYNSSASDFASVTISSPNIHVAWQDNRNGPMDIYYKRKAIIPAVPALISPANNSIGQSVSLNLVWNKSQFALKYRALIATDSLFNNVIINDSLLTDSVKSITNLNPLTNYFWKVSAGNGNTTGWSNFSSTYKFKTLGNPTQVILNQPANNSLNQPVNIVFRWFKAFDQTVKTLAITNYWLEYSPDSNFVNGVVKDSLLTDSIKSVTGLNTVTKYYWRVKAKNIAGWGNFNSIWNFTTAPPVPAAPVLVSPPNNAINQQPNVLLRWGPVQYAAGYRVQVASDSSFNTIVHDTSIVSSDSLRIRYGILTLNTRYFWRVNAVNVSGPGPWSAAWNFTVSPVSISPMNSEIPAKFSLSQNYPNPFNPTTKIRFAISGSSVAQTFLFVYDMLGREISTLVNEELMPGIYEAEWNASNYPSGVYFYRLTTRNFSKTNRMILMK